MKKIFIGTFATVLAGFTFAQTTNWTLDKAHSNVNFSVSHMVVSETTGEFKDISVDVKSDKVDFTDAKINFTAKVNSINTNDEKRDAHLKSPDFFDAEKFPELTFKGKELKKVSEGKYKLLGDLTMHGVTKTVELDVKHGGVVKDPYGNTRAGFKVTGTVNRMDYGVKWNANLDAGGLVVGEEVEFVCNIELIKK